MAPAAPMVSITRQPQVARPMMMPTPPRPSIHNGTWDYIVTSPVRRIDTTAASGPTALATPLAP